MDDGDQPPLKVSGNTPKFVRPTRESVSRVRDREAEAMVVAGGAGVCPIRHFVFVPILGNDG